jgi:hypothetical protein
LIGVVVAGSAVDWAGWPELTVASVPPTAQAMAAPATAVRRHLRVRLLILILRIDGCQISRAVRG